jgi:ABC-type sulfate transport system permease component
MQCYDDQSNNRRRTRRIMAATCTIAAAAATAAMVHVINEPTAWVIRRFHLEVQMNQQPTGR